MFFGPLVDVLVRFEQARVVLGHAVVLDREEIEKIVSRRSESPEAILGTYQAALASLWREEVARNAGNFPDPVLPEVCERRVEHTTCTGRTILRLTAYQPGVVDEPCRGSFAIFRLHGSPLDPEDERDKQLIALVA